MATSATSSLLSVNICDCGKRAKLYTSWSLKNPGRRFYTCSEKRDLRCDYFDLYDAEVEGRHGDVITNLNNRRIYLEEKINLLEEKVVLLEGKLGKKKEKMRALEKKTAKCMNLMIFVIVVLLVVLVMGLQKKDNR